jgi:hypothetical protein
LKLTVPALSSVLPIELPRDQHCDVILDSEGRFLRLVETMPPQINFERFPAPTRAIEAQWRAEEWAEAQAKWWKS